MAHTKRYGVLLPHFGEHASPRRIVEAARAIERYGFDSLWVRDHLVFHPHGMEGTDRTFIEPFVTLTFLAAKTEKIIMGAATVIPFRHPINLAYTVASMSWMTRRPFELGIGAGGPHLARDPALEPLVEHALDVARSRPVAQPVQGMERGAMADVPAHALQR